MSNEVIVIDPLRIRSLLMNKGMSQKRLAEQIPMHQKSLALLLSTKEDRTSRFTTLSRIADILGTTVNDITKSVYKITPSNIENSTLHETNGNDSFRNGIIRDVEMMMDMKLKPMNENIQQALKLATESIQMVNLMMGKFDFVPKSL